MKGLVLAAGTGSRLWPITVTRPKSMIPICGKPIIQYTIENLRDANVKDIIIVVGYLDDHIMDFLGNGIDFGVHIEYVHQDEKKKGVGQAILAAKDLLMKEDAFIIHHPDTLADKEIIERTVAIWKNLKADHALAAKLVEHPQYYGVVEIDSESRVKRFLEKPALGVSKSHYAAAGVFVVKPSLLEMITKHDDFGEAIQSTVDQGSNVVASLWEKEWVELTYPWDLLSANAFILNKLLSGGSFIHNTAEISPRATIMGPVYIGEKAHVLAGATIKGPCFIDKESYIGSNVLLRGTTSIGKKAIIGHGVEVKNSVILDEVQIGRLSYVGDSIIGQNVEFGAGSQAWNVTPDRSPIFLNVNNEQIQIPQQKFGVVMGDRANLAINVSLYPGIIIGQDASIDPGVVVKENIPPSTHVTLKQDLRMLKKK